MTDYLKPFTNSSHMTQLALHGDVQIKFNLFDAFLGHLLKIIKIQ